MSTRTRFEKEAEGNSIGNGLYYKIKTKSRKLMDYTLIPFFRVRFSESVFQCSFDRVLASSKHREEIAAVISQRLISAGSHWPIKLGRWLSEGIRRPIQYPSSDFISQAKFLIGHIKQKEPFLQRPVMEK